MPCSDFPVACRSRYSSIGWYLVSALISGIYRVNEYAKNFFYYEQWLHALEAASFLNNKQWIWCPTETIVFVCYVSTLFEH